MFSKIKGILGKRQKNSIRLEDCKSVNNWPSNLDSNRCKTCNTRSPRYVITDSRQKKSVVYTDSLKTCLGVCLFEKSSNKAVAGLTHLMPHPERNEEKIILKEMIGKLDKKYKPPKLNAVIAVGDDPDPGLFKNTVKVLLKASNISEKRFKIVYGGKGRPYFIDKRGNGMNQSKIAYDTDKMQLYVGES